MKKINFRKMKYIIPAASILPVLFIAYQVFAMMDFTAKEDTTVITEDVNTSLPEVQLDKVKIKSKYQSMLDDYGKVTDYTGVESVEMELEKKKGIQGIWECKKDPASSNDETRSFYFLFFFISFYPIKKIAFGRIKRKWENTWVIPTRSL